MKAASLTLRAIALIRRADEAWEAREAVIRAGEGGHDLAEATARAERAHALALAAADQVMEAFGVNAYAIAWS